MKHEMTVPAISHCPPGKVKLERFQIGSMGEGECFVETRYSAVSPGTELRCLTAKDQGACFVPGYLGVGEIIEAGARSGFQSGDKVIIGGANKMKGIGAQWGCHTKFGIVEKSKLCVVPDGVSELEALFAKLSAIALHGVRLAGIESSDRVLILGLGIVGQLSARIASIRSPHVMALCRNSARVKRAKSSGVRAYEVSGTVEETIRRLFGPSVHADVIIDTTGDPAVVEESISLANDLVPWENPTAQATRYVIQGSYSGHVSINYQKAFQKELNLMFSRDHTRADLAEILDLHSSGELSLAGLIPDLADPHDAEEVYRSFMEPNQDALTAVFDWSLVE